MNGAGSLADFSMEDYLSLLNSRQTPPKLSPDEELLVQIRATEQCLAQSWYGYGCALCVQYRETRIAGVKCPRCPITQKIQNLGKYQSLRERLTRPACAVIMEHQVVADHLCDAEDKVEIRVLSWKPENVRPKLQETLDWLRSRQKPVLKGRP